MFSVISFVFICGGETGPDVLLRSAPAISSFCFPIIDRVLWMKFVDFGWPGQKLLSESLSCVLLGPTKIHSLRVGAKYNFIQIILPYLLVCSMLFTTADVVHYGRCC
jgi:hypothetical protein